MSKYRKQIILILLIAFQGCVRYQDNMQETGSYPEIYPDYINVTIPANIVPLNFKMKEKPQKIHVKISGRKNSITLKSGYKIRIPERRWKSLLKKYVNDSISVSVMALNGGRWQKYKRFSWYVSEDEIDPYLSYRLIEPGYEVWNKLSIRQRNITDFREKVLVDNNLTDNGCINCHTYSMQDPEVSFFHLRHQGGGTIIRQHGRFRKIDTRTDSTISAGVYGSWHPGGRFIAFSTNVIIPEFHSVNDLRLEVYDTISDVVVLDLNKNEIFKSDLTASRNSFETFPDFSSDGRKLYFCTAPAAKMPADYKSVKYSLCSIDFNADNGTFGEIVDTLIKASETGKTVSEPKSSPDGRFLMFTSFDYGNFPIWHMEADLHLLDLVTGKVDALEAVNSDRSDTYHSWSSDSRWFVFASKRDDGMYGKPYFAHIDENGRSTKAFLLPQRDPDFYDYFLKSFNIPELSKGPAPFNSVKSGKMYRKLTAEPVHYRGN